MMLISSTANRKHCGRLDNYMVVVNINTQTGKASLADIFFQKLFGKRRACQNERMAGYMTVWKVMRCMEGYVAVWKVMWLYGRLCGCMEGYVAVWKVMWLYGEVMWLSGEVMWLSGEVMWLSGEDMELGSVARICG